MAVITSLFIAVLATRDRQSPYVPNGSFAGCYRNGMDRLVLGTGGDIKINGSAAGSYKIVKPVGGKHGFLVEADKLRLTGGRGTPVRAEQGDGGFLWPIHGETFDIVFAPGAAMTLRKTKTPTC
jgi:hypothetical protein